MKRITRGRPLTAEEALKYKAERDKIEKEFKSGLPIKLAGQIFLGKTYRCALCNEVIEGFRDRLSAKEFRITGTCQKCQDELFK